MNADAIPIAVVLDWARGVLANGDDAKAFAERQKSPVDRAYATGVTDGVEHCMVELLKVLMDYERVS